MSRPPLSQTPAVSDLVDTLAEACTSVRACFKDRVKVSIVVRNLDHPGIRRDVFFGDDEWPEVKAAVEALLADPTTQEGRT